MADLKVTVNGIVNEYSTVEGNADCFTYVDLQYDPCCVEEKGCPVPRRDIPTTVCIEKPEDTIGGKPVMSNRSAVATVIKDIFGGKSNASLNYIHRIWGVGNSAVFSGDAKFNSDTEMQVLAHRTEADASVKTRTYRLLPGAPFFSISLSENKVECSTRDYEMPTGCAAYNGPRLTTMHYRKTCKEQE